MRKPALLVLLATAVVATVAYAQRRNAQNELEMGSTATPLRFKGEIRPERPVFPTDTTNGLVVDGGATFVGQVKVQNDRVVTGKHHDGGTLGLHLESGTDTCTNGRVAVTFQHTYSVRPHCTCVSQADAGCGLEGPASTTAAVFHGGASSIIDWMCIGTR